MNSFVRAFGIYSSFVAGQFYHAGEPPRYLSPERISHCRLSFRIQLFNKNNDIRLTTDWELNNMDLT
jgi:hypothetical protein